MALPQELIDIILFKFKGLEHPISKMIKEDYFHGNLDDWKEDYDERNKLYFNDIWCSKDSGEPCSCGNEITNGDWCNKKSNGEIFGCWKCSEQLTPEEIQEIEEEEKTIELCWTCDFERATHSTWRCSLNEFELTCDKCHRNEYPEEYEEETDEDEETDDEPTDEEIEEREERIRKFNENELTDEEREEIEERVRMRLLSKTNF